MLPRTSPPGSAAKRLLHLRHEVGVERLHLRLEGRAVRGGGARDALLQRGTQLELRATLQQCVARAAAAHGAAFQAQMQTLDPDLMAQVQQAFGS